MITFTSVFVILFFIFILQSVWLFIAELAGKDLDLIIILKFLSFYAPTMVPLVLPLSVLLASIMVFGSFSENYEFAAMKSSGISLQRAMKSLIVTIAILSLVSFVFANNVIPNAQYRFLNLRKNIVQQKPSMAIAEGQFNTIGNINIKVDKKTGENGEFLEGVIMHIKNNTNGHGANTVIKAKKGELKSEGSSNYLQLELQDGNYYEDVQPKDFNDKKKAPFAKSEFKKYTLNIDLTKLNQVESSSEDITSEKMLNISELLYTVDSLNINYENTIVIYADNIVQRNDVMFANKKVNVIKTKKDKLKDVLSFSSLEQRKNILELAKNSISSTQYTLDLGKMDLGFKKKSINLHWAVIHEKFIIAYSCLLMFFIGAPLGAIIRKGGLGLPMVFAVIIFIAYHFINMFGRKLAEEDALPVFIGLWMSSILLTPFAILFTYRATNDIGMAVNFDWLTEPVKKLFTVNKKEDVIFSKQIVSLNNINFDFKDNDFTELNLKEISTLKSIVKNSDQFEISNDYRLKALKVLENKGITQEELLFTNNLYNSDFIKLKFYIEEYMKNSKTALIFYILAFLLSIIVTITGKILFVVLGLLNLISLYLFIYRSSSDLREVSKINNNNNFINTAISIIAGYPFYAIIYFYNKSKIKEVFAEFNK